jgi:pimeloyl-ACP methyl ester carboxylesterase
MSAADCFNKQFVPGATGHEITNAYLLMVTNRLMFPDQLGVVPSDRADFEDEFLDRFKSFGIDAFIFIHDTPGAQFDTNAVIMSNDKLVIVAFRGTEVRATWTKTIKDLINTDLDFEMVPVPNFGNGAKVHQGFWSAFLQVRRDVLDAVRDQDIADKEVWVTGHSLGGAQAILAARTFRDEGIPVRGLYTYGSPRVGNEAFRDHLGIRNTQRYVYALDLVPMMPDDISLKYCHVGRTNNFKIPLLPGAGPCDSQLELNSPEVKGAGNLFDHDLARYEAALFHHLKAKQQRDVPKSKLRC